MLSAVKSLLAVGTAHNSSSSSSRALSVWGLFGIHPSNETADSAEAALCVVLSHRTPLIGAASVGGKGHNLIKLFRMGVPVPGACVVTCAAYAAGKAARRVPEEVLAVLQRFVDPSSRYAVRSSANCEDGMDSAYAGKFKTILNVPGDLDAVSKAIIECWDSLTAEGTNAPASAQMAVVVMQQIDSQRSGVLFQANPITGSRATHVITAGFGQGEGVVSGEADVDTYSLKASTLKIRNKQTRVKKRMSRLWADGGGTREAEVPEDLQNAQCLTDDEIIAVAKMGKAIRAHCNSPQDIEFCFDRNKKLYILQTRPITTLAETLEWKPPEPGLWQVNGHLCAPLSRFYAPCWIYGHSKGAHDITYIAGAGISRVDATTVNGFAYFCMRRPGPKTPPKSLPPPFILRNIIRLTSRPAIQRARDFWQNKRWREFIEKEYPIRKASWKKEMDTWKQQLENIESVGDHQLASLVQQAQDFGGRMYREHATVTAFNVLPVGHWVRSITEATNCTPVEGYACLDGYSPISQGLCGEFPDQIKLLCEDPALQAELSDPNLIRDPTAALAKWSELTNERQSSTPALTALCEILDTIKYRVADGYDSANGTLFESPTLVFTALQDAMRKHRNGYVEKVQAQSNALAQSLLSRVSDVSKRAELQGLLEEARFVAPLRDERAILTDLTACGIIHHILLEVGKRLARRSDTERDSRLALEASCEELIFWLVRDNAEAPTDDFWKELERRRTYRETANIMDAPPWLGGEQLIPTPDHFPDPYMARSVLVVIFILDHIFEAPDLELVGNDDQALQNDKDVVVGFPGAAGKTEGVARIITDSTTAAELQPGEICITKYPNSLINIVLGNAGGIVTDLGGVLCHAAICAREAQLPCVIGCHSATTRIKTGDLIEVDGTAGIVRILKRRDEHESARADVAGDNEKSID